MKVLRLKIILICQTIMLSTVLFGFNVFAQEALVSVDPVVRHQFSQTVPILGRVVAKQSGTVATRIPGAVSELLVQVGDRVEHGRLIAVIDSEPLKLQKQLAETQKVEAEARITTARAQLTLAAQEVKRLSSLKASASVSKAALDDANQQRNIAFARVKEAEAAVARSTASINVADLELKYANIVAPFNGTVTEKLTEVGSYLQRGQSIARLISDQLVELEANVPSARLDGLKVGEMVTVDLRNNDPYSAVVRAIVPEENPNTRTRRVRFEPDAKLLNVQLASNQSITIHIPAGSSREIVSVHKDAIIKRGGNSIVYVVEENVAKMRTIKTGAASGERLEVLEGLAEGDQIVVRGNERLRPDQQVTISGEQ